MDTDAENFVFVADVGEVIIKKAYFCNKKNDQALPLVVGN